MLNYGRKLQVPHQVVAPVDEIYNKVRVASCVCLCEFVHGQVSYLYAMFQQKDVETRTRTVWQK